MGIKHIEIDKAKNEAQWLQYRNNGIGASEIGTIFGMNPWTSPVELFHAKVGFKYRTVKDNFQMLRGRLLEPIVSTMYEYYHDSEQSVVDNMNENRKVRHLLEIPGFLVNEEYPWIFLSPDRLVITEPDVYPINKGFLDKSEIEKGVEIKTINKFHAKQYEMGIPTSYLYQAYTYSGVLGLDWDIVSLEDGDSLNVVQLPQNNNIKSQIIEKTYTFWENVIRARELVAKGKDYEHLAPELIGTNAESEFLKEKYKNPEEKTIFTKDERLLELALKENKFKEQKKEIEGEIQLCQNQLKNVMGNMTILDFGIRGKITWRADAKGSRRYVNQVE